MTTQARGESGDGRQATADIRFEQLTSEFIAAEYAAQPVMATALGIHAWDDRLDNFNRFFLREERARVRAYLHAIDRLSPVELNAENRINYRLARSSAQRSLARLEKQQWPARQPEIYLETIFEGLFTLIAGEFASPETRAVSLLGRLRSLPEALAEAKQNLTCPPRLFTEIAIETLEAGERYIRHALPRFGESLRARGLRLSLEEAAGAAYSALSDFKRYLREELLPRSSGEIALGRESFDYYLRVVHLMDKERESSEALLEIGREVIAQTEQELTVLADQIEAGTDWKTLVASLNQEGPAPSELLPAYRAEVERAREFGRRCLLLPPPPQESLVVAETPEFARLLSRCVTCLPPAPFEPCRTGMLWVSPVSLTTADPARELLPLGHSFGAISIAALREGYPGRHLQSVSAARHASRFRQHFSRSALFLDGWALYSAELMWEAGYTSDLRFRLMQVWDRLCHACLLALDVQLHTGQMSPREAALWLQNQALMEEGRAWAEVKRCARMPTQAMTSIIGSRALTQLREEMQRRHGVRFDLRQFHERLLSCGSIPSSLLRDVMFSVI